MNKLALLSIFVVLAFIVGCQPAQEGTSKDVDTVPIDKIVVEPGTIETTEVPEEVSTPEEVSEEPPTPTDETETPEVTETAAPETPREIVIIVQETEPVRLKPVAADPDQDALDFTYTAPLNAGGEWQTTYGDAGQYTVTITASDGELTASKDALIIVNKKEESPTIDLAQPEDVSQVMAENTELSFRIAASDKNKDSMTFSWKLDGEEVSTSDSYAYSADYASAGTHTLKAEVSDGATSTSMIWSISVKNVDRAPVLSPLPDVTVRETETVKLAPQATDPDADPLTFHISDPIGDTGEWQTTYDDAGVYTVEVSVSDGEMEDSQTVKVTVINVNRPPVIEDIVQVQ